MLGLAGCHRCGKSTLAARYAQEHDAYFLQTSVTAFIQQAGYDPAKTYDLPTRLKLQRFVLDGLDASFANAPRGVPIVTDRTPLDLIAYTMADAVADQVPEHAQEEFARYIQDCINITNARFDRIILVQPGIPIVHAPGKGAPNKAFMEHLNAILQGMTADERVLVPCYILPRATLDLDERVAFMRQVAAPHSGAAMAVR